MFFWLCLLIFTLGQSALAVGCLCEKEGYAFWQSNPPSKKVVVEYLKDILKETKIDEEHRFGRLCI